MANVPLTVLLPATLTAKGLGDLREAVDALSDDDVVILKSRAEGRVFCLGMDFAGFTSMPESDLLAGLSEYARILRRLFEGNFASIAVVEGDAIGGGVGLAAACDVVIATDQARFGLPEALYGFSPAVVSVILRERVSPQAVRLMALRCDTIDAVAAERMGMVDVLTSAERLEKTVKYETRRLGRAAVEGRKAVKQRFSGSSDIGHAMEEAIRLTHSRLIDKTVRDRLGREAVEP